MTIYNCIQTHENFRFCFLVFIIYVKSLFSTAILHLTTSTFDDFKLDLYFLELFSVDLWFSIYFLLYEFQDIGKPGCPAYATETSSNDDNSWRTGRIHSERLVWQSTRGSSIQFAKINAPERSGRPEIDFKLRPAGYFFFY